MKAANPLRPSRYAVLLTCSPRSPALVRSEGRTRSIHRLVARACAESLNSGLISSQYPFSNMLPWLVGIGVRLDVCLQAEELGRLWTTYVMRQYLMFEDS